MAVLRSRPLPCLCIVVAAAAIACAGNGAGGSALPAEEGGGVVLLLQESWPSREKNEEERRAVAQTFALSSGDAWRLHIEPQVVPFEPDAAREAIEQALARVKPTVVLTASMGSALRFKEFGDGSPLVFSGSADPVALCLVDSFTKPGLGATGYSGSFAAAPKIVEVLREAYPSVRRATVLFDGNVFAESFACGVDESTRDRARHAAAAGCSPGTERDSQQLDLVIDASEFVRAARELQLELRFHRICKREHLTAFVSAWMGGADEAVIVPNGQLMQEHAEELAALLNARSVPTIYEGKRFAEVGGVLAVGPTPQLRTLQQGSEMAMLVLAGERIENMPVRTPSGVSVWINLKTAASSGVLPSVDVVRRADGLMR